MRVVLPLGGTDWGRSGIGTYVRSIIPHLDRSLRERGSNLLVMGNDRELSAYEACLLGISVLRTPSWADSPAQSALWYLTRAGAFARRHGADVVLYPAAQRRNCFSQPVPSVAVVHDLGQLKVADKYSRLRMFYFKHVALRLIRRAARPVAISSNTRDEMVAALGLSSAQISVVPNGVDAARFEPQAPNDLRLAAARAETGLGEPYLLYPARLEHPAKNHLRLLEAFASSHLRQSHLLALSGGDWGGRTLIEQKAAELGLGDRVRFLGYVADVHLPSLICGADVVIMVGLTEGFGLPALEALAAGRPVCAASAGALPEVVGTLAALCDPYSIDSIRGALEVAADDSSFRQRCRDEGPAWARTWGWDVTGERLAEVCLGAAAASLKV